MRAGLRARVLGLLLLGLWLPAAAGAQGGKDAPGSLQTLQMEVTVVEASDSPGEVDPRARRVDRVLRGQVPYQSLRVLDVHRRRVAVDEVWRVGVPKGELRIRPMDVGGRGALLSVDWTGVVQGDFRVRPGSPLVFGGPGHGDGKLVVVVETR